jgi:hypothetical protein
MGSFILNDKIFGQALTDMLAARMKGSLFEQLSWST